MDSVYDWYFDVHQASKSSSIALSNVIKGNNDSSNNSKRVQSPRNSL